MQAIERVGVIGAGTMGNGIAQACAVSGVDVVMVDVAQAAVDRGLAAIGASLERLEKKEKITAGDARIGAVAHSRHHRLRRPEGRQSDHRGGHGKPRAEAADPEAGGRRWPCRIPSLASNTSSISITALAAVVSRPERFLGMHFFNPVPLMALVELIRGLQTSDATLASVRAFAERLGKTPIVVRNSPGFVVNRILCPMINEAIFALQEGLASAEDIDNGMRLGCNHPIGPLALADMIGLDVMLAVMNVFYTDFNDPKYRPAPLLKEMVAAGYLGRKTKRGFYRYDA